MLRQQDLNTDALAQAIQTGGLTAQNWITAGSILVVGLVLAWVAKRVTTGLLDRKLDRAISVLIGRLVAYTAVVIVMVYVLDELGVAIGPLLGALGIAGIALAFALRDILENFVAGLLLQMQRPFRYGDQVSVDDFEGTVVDIGTRIVTVLTPAGETVKIPCSTVIKADINNYTEHGRRRTTLPIGVAYGTDLSRACDLLHDGVAKVGGVLEEPEVEVLVDQFGASSVDLVVRYWHRPTIAEHWRTKSAVAMKVESVLAEADITIPFPQQTLWWGSRDGEADRD